MSIPANWPSVKLGDIATFEYGFASCKNSSMALGARKKYFMANKPSTFEKLAPLVRESGILYYSRAMHLQKGVQYTRPFPSGTDGDLRIAIFNEYPLLVQQGELIFLSTIKVTRRVS